MHVYFMHVPGVGWGVRRIICTVRTTGNRSNTSIVVNNLEWLRTYIVYCNFLCTGCSLYENCNWRFVDYLHSFPLRGRIAGCVNMQYGHVISSYANFPARLFKAKLRGGGPAL